MGYYSRHKKNYYSRNNRNYRGGKRSRSYAYPRRYQQPALTTKYVDFNLLNGNVDQTNLNMLCLLNNIVSGTNLYNRIGSKVKAKSIRINASIVMGQANYPPAPPQPIVSPVTQKMRILLLYDRQPNGKLITSTADVLQDINLDGVKTTTPTSGFNRENSNRFAILRDYFLTAQIPDTTFAPSSPGCYFLKDYIKIQSPALQQCVFRTSIDQAADSIWPTTGAFYLLYASDQSVVQNYRLDGSIRFSYTDA